jgi:hypothetical protein
MISAELKNVPQHVEQLIRLNDATWPEFLLHGDVRRWSSLYDRFAEFQILWLEDDMVIAAGLTVPFAWNMHPRPPATIDEVVYSAEWPIPAGKGVLCALAALVAPEHRGKGLSREILQSMRDLSAAKALDGLLAPVRPTRKHEFPFEPIESYVSRRDSSGHLWDPWLRVHEMLGGRQLEIARRALTVRGSLEEWERWTGKKFKASGPHVIEGGLVPVVIDREEGVGIYEEPNIWYFHENPARGGSG